MRLLIATTFFLACESSTSSRGATREPAISQSSQSDRAPALQNLTVIDVAHMGEDMRKKSHAYADTTWETATKQYEVEGEVKGDDRWFDTAFAQKVGVIDRRAVVRFASGQTCLYRTESLVTWDKTGKVNRLFAAWGCIEDDEKIELFGITKEIDVYHFHGRKGAFYRWDTGQ